MAVALAVALGGCGSGLDPGTPGREGGYDFRSDGVGGGRFEGKWTTWDPTIGVVVLGPEEAGEPVAQLIIDFQALLLAAPSQQAWRARSVTFSTTTQRVGTGDEINAALYELDKDEESACRDLVETVAIHDDHIAGRFCFSLDRVIVNPGDPTETIRVHGEFLAVTRRWGPAGYRQPASLLARP